jgi:hypothetical protein
MPPISAAGTAPSQAAIAPARNSPSWFDAPMNNPLTEVTRPRIASGVASCTSVMRITTLIMSDAPSTASAASATTKEPASANTMVEMP